MGKLKLLYILVFSENVTTRIKESLARRVLKLEELQAVTVRGENISIIDYIGLFDTEQQLKNANATNDGKKDSSRTSRQTGQLQFAVNVVLSTFLLT